MNFDFFFFSLPSHPRLPKRHKKILFFSTQQLYTKLNISRRFSSKFNFTVMNEPNYLLISVYQNDTRWEFIVESLYEILHMTCFWITPLRWCYSEGLMEEKTVYVIWFENYTWARWDPSSHLIGYLKSLSLYDSPVLFHIRIRKNKIYGRKRKIREMIKQAEQVFMHKA